MSAKALVRCVTDPICIECSMAIVMHNLSSIARALHEFY